MDHLKKLLWFAGMAFFTVTSAQILKEGNSCTTTSGEHGICISLPNCPYAIEDIKIGQSPKVCSFQGKTPIVCCPSNLESTDKTSKPTKSKNEEKCQEYGQAVYQQTPLENSNGKNVNVSLCFERPLVGGGKVQPKEYPHLALIGFNKEDNPSEKQWPCIGNLISDRYIVTVAHCLQSQLGTPKYVRLGDLNGDTEENIVEFSIQEVIIHPKYQSRSSYNDIGLLKLDQNVKFNAFIRPVCLDTKSHQNIDKATVTGTALPNFGNSEYSSGVLSKVVEITPWKTCNDAFGINVRVLPKGIDDETQICAQSIDHRDSCVGVSGSPLQIPNPDVYCMTTIVGLTSMGLNCARNSPEIFTRISAFVPWIESVVWN